MLRLRTFDLQCRKMMVLALISFTMGGPLLALPVHRNGKKRVSRQTIEALEEQWRQAQLTADASAMDRLLADDFVGITAFGQVTTKAQQLSRVRDRVLVLTRLDLSDMKIKVIGPIAVVTTRAEIDGRSDGAPLSGTFRYTRVYHRLLNGAWKITSFEATRVPSGEVPHGRHESDSPQP